MQLRRYHMKYRKAAPVLGLVILALAAFWYYGSKQDMENEVLTASGSIEARTVRIVSEMAGRVSGVYFSEGTKVKAGDILVQLDTALLSSQVEQAEAALESARAGYVAALSAVEAAQASANAAGANYALAVSGPPAEQIKLAQTAVDRARIPVDALQEAYNELTDAAQETRQGKDLKQQLDLALSTLASAQAQYELAEAGARPEQLAALEAQVQAAVAQVKAAQAQAEVAAGHVSAAQAAVETLKLQVSRLSIKSPVEGVILSRSIEPGEFAAPGSVLLVVGVLDELHMTVYIPEDRYGSIRLGDQGRVYVDSHPDQSFLATVIHIADRAEFTPRNVQTEEGRRTTVFAVKLALENEEQALKPGMMADIVFEADWQTQ
jgi:HlyD family secretion protein